MPENWESELDTERTIFDKNFLYLEFEHTVGRQWREILPMHQDFVENGDALILNLSSRKPFWIKMHLLEIEIKAKVRDQRIPSSFAVEQFGPYSGP